MPWTVLGLAIACLVALNILFVLLMGAASHRQREDGFVDMGVGYAATDDETLI